MKISDDRPPAQEPDRIYSCNECRRSSPHKHSGCGPFWHATHLPYPECVVTHDRDGSKHKSSQTHIPLTSN